jgi:multicomponent Na+:H+ antiporter subunit E
MKNKIRSRLTVFISSSLIWFALTNITDLQEVIAGLMLSFIVSLIAGQFMFTTEKSKPLHIKIIYCIKYFLVFLVELFKANLNVASIVLHPTLPIKPGIVKVKTNLSKDSTRTVLCNSITLTPGTMTVDINPDTNEIYIHWIAVVSKDPENVEENTKNISKVFEKLLVEVSR